MKKVTLQLGDDEILLIQLARSVNDGEFALQVVLVKIQIMLRYNDTIPDDLWTGTGSAIAALRAKIDKLESFLLILSERPDMRETVKVEIPQP